MKNILTSGGTNLILRGLLGSKIEFTKIKYGNGEMPSVTAVDLSNPIMEVQITSITRESNFITLGAAYKNAEVPADFSAREIGLFAKDPDDETKDILYCFWYEEDPVKADYISSVDDRILETKVEFLVFVDAVENVTAVIAESTEFATKAALNTHTNDQTNPHRVTKDQVGLGNVPNVTPENQVPTFDEEIGPVNVEVSNNADGTSAQTTNFPNIEKGDTLGAMIKKIRTAIHMVLIHLNGSNPHLITPKMIKAAAENHYHSANDINSGVLGIPRGGTGGKSAAEAKRNLGIQCGTATVHVSNSLTSVGVDFPYPYTGATARVVITPKSLSSGSGNRGLNECDLSVVYVTGGYFVVQSYSDTVDGDITFDWIAVQP